MAPGRLDDQGRTLKPSHVLNPDQRRKSQLASLARMPSNPLAPKHSGRIAGRKTPHYTVSKDCSRREHVNRDTRLKRIMGGLEESNGPTAYSSGILGSSAVTTANSFQKIASSSAKLLRPKPGDKTLPQSSMGPDAPSLPGLISPIRSEDTDFLFGEWDDLFSGDRFILSAGRREIVMAQEAAAQSQQGWKDKHGQGLRTKKKCMSGVSTLDTPNVMISEQRGHHSSSRQHTLRGQNYRSHNPFREFIAARGTPDTTAAKTGRGRGTFTPAEIQRAYKQAQMLQQKAFPLSIATQSFSKLARADRAEPTRTIPHASQTVQMRHDAPPPSQ
ncbi:uncharacterized protein PV07_04251 [Cladophialophora immunda]|uniref:Uncharacterized protein n=1 Tax=Cladophialophora immunda TaxID=569365 RepID=A0A0D2CN93_9EURO|nr:uncharacterized protein PV07_04251 [Cladophialophora immunda]KIW32723.1 hypothetical protein PV07_04251 [Cladophialophora immunda]